MNKFFLRLKFFLFLFVVVSQLLNPNLLNASGYVWTAQEGAKGGMDRYFIASSADGTKLATIISGGYIYTSIDSGITWTERTSAGARKWSSVVSSADGTKLFATDPSGGGNGGYIYVSDDLGATWTALTGAGARFWSSIATSADGTKLVAIDASGGAFNGWSGGYIYTSIDSGITWTERTSAGARKWSSVVSSADGEKLAIINADDGVSGGYIYTSTDSGATWNEYTAAGKWIWQSITISSNGTNLAAVGERSSNWNDGKVYISTDSGASWTQQVGAPAKRWSSITSSANGSKLAVSPWGGNIYTSNDSGVSWVEQVGSGSNSWRGIISSADGAKLAVVNEGDHVYTSTDFGVNWIRQSASSFGGYWSGLSSSADGTVLVAAVASGYIYTSTDSGISWTEQTGTGQRYWTSVALSADGSKLVATSNSNNNNVGYVYVSSDFGNTWTEKTGLGTGSWESSAISADGSKMVVSKGSNIYTSADFGNTWTIRSGIGPRYWTSIALSADGNRLVGVDSTGASYTGGYIYISADFGSTWTVYSGLGVRRWSSIATSADGTKLVASVNNGYIYTSSDSGATWTEHTSTGQKYWNSVSSSADGTKLIVAVYNGYIYTSSDSGATWTEQINTGNRIWKKVALSSDGNKSTAIVLNSHLYTGTFDDTAPTIDSPLVIVSDTGSTITWTTSETSSSQIEYGLNSSLGSTTPVTDVSVGVTDHRVEISSLVPCTVYYYRPISIDQASNQSVGETNVFITNGCVVGVGASVTDFGLSQITNNVGGGLTLVTVNSGLQLSIPVSISSTLPVETVIDYQAKVIDPVAVLSAFSVPFDAFTSDSNVNTNQLISDVFDLKAYLNTGTTLSTFDAPIPIAITFTDEQINNIDASTLSIYRHDGDAWHRLDSVVDLTNHRLTASTEHFSIFGIFGQSSYRANNNSSSANNSSSSNSSGCGDEKPASIPDLFEVYTTATTAKLKFTPINNTNRFYISFSTKANAEEHGAEITLGREGEQYFTVSLLKPNTTYYFKVRGQNGCMPGEWSRILAARTTSGKRVARYFPNSFIPKTIKTTSVTSLKKSAQTVSLPISTMTNQSNPVPTTIPETPRINPPVSESPTQIPISTPSKKCFLFWCW